MLYHRFITIALFITTFLMQYANAQSENKVTLNWIGVKNQLFKGTEQALLTLDNAYYLESENGMPCVLISSSAEQIALNKETYIPLTQEELGYIDTSLIQSNAKLIRYQGTLNKRPAFIHYVLPFRKNEKNNSIEKLTSYEYRSLKPIANRSNLARKSSLNSITGFFANNSVLASGDWYKLSISSSTTNTGSGIYKLDHNFLASIGFPVNTIDPRKIRIHGNANAMLPFANAVDRADDLMENSIYVKGEEDGKFDKDDYILFYAKGPHQWIYNKSLNNFSLEKNIYSEEAFYFLTYSISDDLGKRVKSFGKTLQSDEIVNTSPTYEFFETDEFNLLSSGNKWYSNPVEAPFNLSYNISGHVPSSPIALKCEVMTQARLQTNFRYQVNNEEFRQNVNAYSFTSQYADKGRESKEIFTINNQSSSSLNIGISYNKSGNNTSRGFIDKIEIKYDRNIGLYGNQTNFYVLPSTVNSIKKIVIASTIPEQSVIWDITQPTNIEGVIPTTTSGSLSFSEDINTLKEYCIFSGANFATPRFAGKVNNQNLHGIVSGSLPDMVIITVPSLIPAANRLKQHRKSHNNLEAKVVTTDQIYNEFSSGKQDLTAIRDFLRMLYKRGDSSDSTSLVLLFGAASYDYKNRIPNNTNIVPIFESAESLHNVDSYCSDDYIVLLDDNEGDWEENVNQYISLDMGVGRLPVRNLEEAEGVVNKIIDYDLNPSSKGKWRNKISFAADDTSPGESPNTHALNSEVVSNRLMDLDNNLNIDKYFVDAFQQLISPGGEIAPELKIAYLRNLNQGNLITNFSGHGSEFLWCQEDIININDIDNLKNKFRLPFFITATCEFGRYEDPSKFSGALALILNSQGGAIGLLTSTRPVYATSNTNINRAYFQAQFPPSSRQRIYPNLGIAMMNTKNDRSAQSGINNRNYALLGDPSLTLAFPKEEVVITKINGKRIGLETTDTLKALRLVTIEGEIQKNGQLQNNFIGSVNLSLFDKMKMVSSIGAPPNRVMNYPLRNSLIYDGSVSVDSGKFKFNFVIPKDIDYNIGSAKFSFYAQSKDGRDAGGTDETIQLGKSASNIAIDNTPPSIRLFMDDTTFVNGGITNTNTKLVAKLFDENGINISSSGIGHQITGSLSSEDKIFVMNEFYTTVNNSYKQGMVEYPFNNLQPGKYSIFFKAWDTYNNSGTSSIDFIVASDEIFALQQVMNFPNPFYNTTNISFDHNRAGEDLELTIEISNVKGILVKTIRKDIPQAPTTISDINWEGSDNYQTRLSAGSYIYKIVVKSKKDNAKAFSVERMVLLN
ncbi:MAG: hypothetical protein EAZ07_03690 [Cytophagales bacterium]|nr:MAG: hypothetical protein EAZ07_03690 [Cytophagales bacterium]